VSVDIKIDATQRLVYQEPSTEIIRGPYLADRPFTSFAVASWLLAIAVGVAFWTILLLYIMPAIVRFISLYWEVSGGERLFMRTTICALERILIDLEYAAADCYD
jgi:hypothetical protein